MPTLTHYAPTEIPLAIKYQLLSAVRIEWLWNLKGDLRFRDYTTKKTALRFFVISEKDVLISFAEVNQRVLSHVDREFKVYGLTSVFTYPGFRQEGYGHQIVQAASDFIQSSEADVAILFRVPELKHFYQAHGWLSMDTATILYGAPENPEIKKKPVSMMFVSDKGKQHQSDFADLPVYVGQHTW